MRKNIKFILLTFLVFLTFFLANNHSSNLNTSISIQAPPISEFVEDAKDKLTSDSQKNYESYYVSVSGRDSNDGSINKPFRNINKALSIAKSGSTIYVYEGTYNESLKFSNSGKKDAPIILKSFDGKAVIDGSGLSQSTGILVSNLSYIKIEGLHIQNFISKSANTAFGIKINGFCKSIEIKDCKISNVSTDYYTDSKYKNAHGIGVYGTIGKENSAISDLVISGNEIYDCKLGSSEAVAINGNVDSFKILNNKIYNNDNIAIDFIGFEGTAKDKSDSKTNVEDYDRARNGICSGNEIRNISCRNNPTYKGAGLCAAGIYADGAFNIIIEKNLIDKCDIGIEIASENKGKNSEAITVRNNLIANCKGFAGISIGGADKLKNGSAIKTEILNNTLYNNQPNIMIQAASSKTNIIANNICYRGSFLEGSKGKNIITNNFTDNPNFVNTTTWNFLLKEDSKAIDAGIKVNYGKKDFEDQKRISGDYVDLGAFEYQQ